MRYIVYARKSSESEERQAQSIDDQLADLRALAQQRGLTVVEEISESRSAKAPGGRPLFDLLVKKIQNGDADGILCWHVNRLFRNPVDFGTVSWLLQTGGLQEVHTPHQVYRTGDNVLLLSVENGMANQYILDLKKVVERGLRSKIDKGIPPQVAPEGYLNNLHTHTIESDPERFPVIRRAWDLMLTGAYTVPQVREILNEQWGYRTKAHRKVGGRPLSRPQAYRMFNNLFYTGHFLREGLVHPGSYPPMITLQEYEQVQNHLGRRGNTRPQKRIHSYTGFIRCGLCGCMVTADVTKDRIYYHCTNARGNCTKRGITEADLDRQLRRELAHIHLRPELEAMLLDIIGRFETAPLVQVQQECKLLRRQLEEREAEMGELVLMRARRLIDDAVLLQSRTRLHQEINHLRISIGKLEVILDKKHDNAVAALHFASHAAVKFDQADVWVKREIIKKLGGSYALAEKKLTLQAHPLLHYIGENKEAIEQAIIGFDKQKRGTLQPSVSFGGADETFITFLEIALRHDFIPLGLE